MSLRITTCCLLPVLLALASCSNKLWTSGEKPPSAFAVVKKYSPDELKRDFDLLRSMMEHFHPSLYWYTSKDSMDAIFELYRSSITDSLTEQQFGFRIIAPVTTSIRCGHTSFSYSKKYNKAMRGVRLPSFPLHVKVWGDSMVVTGNLNKKDSLVKPGMWITSIDGYSPARIRDFMFSYLPTDGYSLGINYIRLSNAFPYYHRNIFGLKKSYTVGLTDSSGEQKLVVVPVYDPVADTLAKIKPEKKERMKKPGKKQRLEMVRHLKIEGETKSAVMELNSFDGGFRLNKFFRRSFRKLRQREVEHLVIDIRSNGGGKVNHFTRLTQYLRRSEFRVADSAFALKKKFSPYGRYFSTRTLNSIALGIFTSKRKDGNYHFNYWEKHRFKPKKNNFFNGKVYVLIAGPTFSASALFAHNLKGQDNVLLVGEETGGASHGNNGLMIPNITLPNTGIRVRMPLFRLIQYNHGPKDGRGIMPDVYVAPSARAVIDREDLKMKKAMELIRAGYHQASN